MEQHTCVLNIFILHILPVLSMGKGVSEARVAMGRQLAKETQYEADIVMPIPSSGDFVCSGVCRGIWYTL